MLIMQAFAQTPKTKSEQTLGGSSIETSTLRLENGKPQIIPIKDATYSEMSMEAIFGKGKPEILVTFTPTEKNSEPVHFIYEADEGRIYSPQEPGGGDYDRVIASFEVLAIEQNSMEISLETYDRPNQVRFEGFPRYSNGTIYYSLYLGEPRDVTVSLYTMTGQKLPLENAFGQDHVKTLILGRGTYDLNLQLRNPEDLARQLIFLVVGVKEGVITKKINTLGGTQ